MAQYKTLKSVAHNMGHSFLSTMNYYRDDYALGHIQRQMLLTGENKIEIDFLTKKAYPTELLNDAIQKSIDNQVSWFPKMVLSSKSKMEFIRSAKLTIEFDLTRQRPCPFSPGHTENPYYCISKIVDDKGKEYKYKFSDWWFPESDFIEKNETNNFAKFRNWLAGIIKTSANTN